MGTLTMYVGPMFSGKTTKMLSEITRHRHAGCNCVIVKWSRDIRGSHNPGGPVSPRVCTHDGADAHDEPRRGRMGSLRIVVAATLAEVALRADEAVVGVDEGQFFADLQSGTASWDDRTVIVSALDGTWQRRIWPSVAETLPHADYFVKLQSVCGVCVGGPVAAPFTLRLRASTEDVEVGGENMYRAVCRKCYLARQAPPEV